MPEVFPFSSEAWNNYFTLRQKIKRHSCGLAYLNYYCHIVSLLSFFSLKIKGHNILYLVADLRPTSVLCRCRCGWQLHTVVC